MDQFKDVGFAKLDMTRRERTGCTETVYCPGKSSEQLAGILANLASCALGENRSFNRIEVSFYGNIHNSAEAMFLPICSGIFSDAEPFLNELEAQRFLESKGNVQH